MKFLLFTTEPFTPLPDTLYREQPAANDDSDADADADADAKDVVAASAEEAELARAATAAGAAWGGRAWWRGGPVGEYIGPHAGETLRARVARMRRQLALPRARDAQAYLRATFGSGDGDEHADVAVASSAFLKGFFFYPFNAWEQGAAADADADAASAHGGRDDDAAAALRRVAPPCWRPPPLAADDAIAADASAPSTSLPLLAAVAPGHWCGWWSRDAAVVVRHPRHAASKWLILPKAEWLSPAVARCGANGGPDDDADDGVCSRLLDADGLLAAVAAAAATLAADEAAEVAAAAAAAAAGGDAAAAAAAAALTRRQRCWAESRRRRRRLMVAEMQPLSRNANNEDASSRGGGGGDDSEGGTLWVEVSRGFLVEGTWPPRAVPAAAAAASEAAPAEEDVGA